jgi:hypothetical protein
MDLATNWANACYKLWVISEGVQWIDREELTVWDAFKLLYLERIKNETGREVINPDVLIDSRQRWEESRRIHVSRKTQCK